MQVSGQLCPFTFVNPETSIMRFFTVALLATFAVSVQAQTNVDPRLQVKFGEERLADLQKNHPSVIDYWTFYLDNSYFVADLAPAKDAGEIPSVKIDDISRFNILALDVHPMENGNRIYRIEGTDKLLVLHSTEKIAEMFNEYRNSR